MYNKDNFHDNTFDYSRGNRPKKRKKNSEWKNSELKISKIKITKLNNGEK